jgi:hypothetical protein
VRRNEDDNVEDGRADGEHAPQDGDGARVSGQGQVSGCQSHKFNAQCTDRTKKVVVAKGVDNNMYA